MAFHIFVDGPVDASPDAIQRLAAAMSQRYGLPQADLVARLSKGRFRVKANVDAATAQTYQRDLGAIGARVTIEPVQATSATPAPRASNVSLPPANVRAPGTTAPPTSILPPRAPGTTSPPTSSALPPAKPGARSAAPQFQSGLAAAFSQEIPVAADFAALEGLQELSLGSLDGKDDPKPSASFEPPGTFAASIGPPPDAPAPKAAAPARPAAKGERPRDVPLDLFAPPEAQGEQELKFELASEEIEERARKRANTPPPVQAVSAPTSPPLQRKSTPSIQPPNVVATVARRPMSRAGFAAGVLLAIGLGFAPAHFIAQMRTTSAFAEIDNQVNAYQAQLDSEEAFAALDAFRAKQLERKKSERQNIALLASAVWLAAAAAFAFAWFRLIKWPQRPAS